MCALQEYGQKSRKSETHIFFAMLLLLFGIFAGTAFAQAPKNSGALHGQLTDPSGAVVIGAAVTVTSPDGQTQSAISDKFGNYAFHGLPSGMVTVKANASGFSPYQLPNVIIPSGGAQQLNIALDISVKQEQVTVQSENENVVDVNPENNASATILKGADLEALSDDPDELEQDLLALAGPSVGPNGGQIYIDGFSNGTLPPKSAIREIRINQNPFSAEYDKAGFGRVEVFTKPGSNTWHGQAMFNENNSEFNSRNPYVLSDIPPYHSELYSGNVSGSLSKRLSMFLNAERRDINETSPIDATLPGSSYGETMPYTAAILAPRTRTNLAARFDYQLTPSNTLTARYQLLVNNQQNQGISATTLSSQAYTIAETQHTVQLSDTQIISPHVITETRFQYIGDQTSQFANLSGTALSILGEVSEGGNPAGNSRDNINRYELQSYTSWAAGKHFIKFGGRLRVSDDVSNTFNNPNGTLIFSGDPANGITPIEAYQLGTPSQYSVISVINPRVSLPFADVGLYAEDDWKLRPNLTLSYGLRFESQSNISNQANFAPRLGLSWGLGSAKSAPKTVLRFGYGIFYDRFTEDLVMQTEHINGFDEMQTIYASTTTAPITCTPSPTTHSDCNLPVSDASNTLYQINSNLHAPYVMQSAVSLERQLPMGTVSFTYLNSRGLHQLDQINANAPDPYLGGVRPLAQGYLNDNVYQYDSEGIFKQNQLITNVQMRLGQKFSLMGYYALGYANSDTAGPSSSPSNSFDLTQDYGRASFDIRQRLFLSGSASLAHNIRISPFVIAASGAPFNIITGQDNNGDSFFNDRPAFCTAQSANPVSTTYGCFDLRPTAGERIIPINYGKGDANVTVNLRLSKTFGFGSDTKGESSADSGSGAPRHSGAGHGPGGGLAGPRGNFASIFGPSNTSRRYNLTLTMMARNLFNTWNPGTPVGNLSSTRFGETNSLATGPFSSGTANRRVDFQALFSF